MAKTAGAKGKIAGLFKRKKAPAPAPAQPPAKPKVVAAEAKVSLKAVLAICADESDNQSARENGQAWVNCAARIAELARELPTT